MSDNRRDVFMNIGSSLLSITFLLLLFVTFAVLSFVNARGNLSFSQKMADSKQDYYVAVNKAEDVLCEIKSYLHTGQTVDQDLLRSIDPGIVYQNDMVLYQININNEQALAVKLLLTPDNSYKIMQWQVVSTKKWQGEDKLKLMPIL